MTRPIVIVGDSFAAGIGASKRITAYPAQLQQVIGRRVITVAGGGTGFLCDGPKRPILGSRGRHLSRINRLPAEMGLLLIQASANDRFYEPDDLRAAIIDYLDRIAAGTPTIIFGPIYANTKDRPERVQMVVDAHREIAAERGIEYVDGRPWFADAKQRGLVAPDGGHPSDAGHRLIAQELAALLDHASIAG